MIQIPQSTARVVMLKVFETGTTTAATGKTVAVVISKAGGAFGNPNAGATNATEVSAGWYKVTLDTTDTGTVGDLVVRGTATGCDATERIFGVVKATNGGLTGIPDAAADAAGGLPISDAGGLDLDAKLANTNEVTAARMGALTDWIDGGRLDLILDARASQASVDDVPTVAEFEARTVTSATYATAANLATVAGYLDTEIAAILADTNELQTDWANGGRLDLILDARASQTSVDDLPTNAELATALGTADDAILAAISALNNLSAAQVNAEVVDALATDTYAEPTGAPAATAALSAKINYLYMALRNKVTVTSSAKTFCDDGGAAEWSKALSDDGTTYTEAEGA